MEHSKRFLFSILLLSILACASHAQCTANNNNDRILFRDLHAVTFHSGVERAHQRVPGGPQLICTGGSAGCSAFEPQVVLCRQVGNDQWRCESDMPDDFAFGQLQVVCEGHEFADDPYVLKDSCSLDYHLELTTAGHQRQRSKIVGIVLFVLVVIGSVVYSRRSGVNILQGKRTGSTHHYFHSRFKPTSTTRTAVGAGGSSRR